MGVEWALSYTFRSRLRDRDLTIMTTNPYLNNYRNSPHVMVHSLVGEILAPLQTFPSLRLPLRCSLGVFVRYYYCVDNAENLALNRGCQQANHRSQGAFREIPRHDARA